MAVSYLVLEYHQMVQQEVSLSYTTDIQQLRSLYFSVTEEVKGNVEIILLEESLDLFRE